MRTRIPPSPTTSNSEPLALPVWHAELLGRLLDVDIADRRTAERLAPHVARLSEHFCDTGRRGAAGGGYLRDRHARDAYSLYYGSANLLKLLVPLRELAAQGFFDDTRPCTVLDAGCGTGTGLLGLLVHAGREAAGTQRAPRFSYTGVDSQPAAVDCIASLCRLLGDAQKALLERFEARRADLILAPQLGGRWRLVLAMNVLNELPESSHGAFLEWCGMHCESDGAVVILEPALRATSRALLRLRDRALHAGWTVASPCFFHGDCPALASENDWCHHACGWRRPAFIADIDRRIGNRKEALKFSYLILNRCGRRLSDALPAECSWQRVVSELLEEKGRKRLYCCGGQGRRLYMKNNRDTTPANRAFDALRRYDIVAVDGEEIRGHDVLLGAGSSVTRQ